MNQRKKSIVTLACGIAAGIFLTLAVRATTQVFVGTTTLVNGTNNGAAVWTGQMSLPRGTFYIQNGGLTNGVTNCLTGYVQVSLDSNNWVNQAQYFPTITNATIDAFSPYVLPTLYMRFVTVTTNPVNVLASWSYP